jgi:hypothetical protein
MYRFNGWMKEKVNHHTFEKKKSSGAVDANIN